MQHREKYLKKFKNLHLFIILSVETLVLSIKFCKQKKKNGSSTQSTVKYIRYASWKVNDLKVLHPITQSLNWDTTLVCLGCCRLQFHKARRLQLESGALVPFIAGGCVRRAWPGVAGGVGGVGEVFFFFFYQSNWLTERLEADEAHFHTAWLASPPVRCRCRCRGRPQQAAPPRSLVLKSPLR